MNHFLKSKVVLSLAAFMMIATAIAIPLSSFSVHTHAQGTVTITEFPVPTSNFSLVGITAGSDGNLWFIDQSANKIGRITPIGTVTEFSIPTANSSPYAITAGPDGNLWFTESNPNLPVNHIGRITPTGTVTEFPLPAGGSNLLGITAGPDGNLWFTVREANDIGRITPSGVVTEFPIPTANSFPEGITAGPDGNLWFTEPVGNGNVQIGRITTSGTITEFPIPTASSFPVDITKGSDGNLWFTEEGANQIGRITPAGMVTEFPIPTTASQPQGITAGPDGNLWFTEENGNQIGQITPSGVVSEFPVPTANSQPFYITAGPDGNLWFTENGTNQIGRVNLASTTPSPTPTPHRKLVIFLQGITTSLKSNQANNGVILGMNTVPSTVKKVFPDASTMPDANTRFLEYSYFASRTDNGLPSAYNCVDTITNTLFADILLLDKQIENAFNVEPQGADVDIYLIGHSLGGVVALGYLEFLEQGGLFVSLPAGAHLKAVITLDSPIGGVAKGFLSDFSALGGQILAQQCPAVKGQPLTAPKELETIFGSSSSTTTPEPEDSGANPQGSQASILAEAANFVSTLPNPLPSSENLVEQAQTNLGTSFLSIGNLNDFLFNPHACSGVFPSFLDTMFLEDDSDGGGLYGRDFVSGPSECPINNINQTTQIVTTNHFAVLSDGTVQTGIQNFLTPLVSGNVGGTPSPLPVTPFQSPDS